MKTHWINRRFFSAKINVDVPTRWNQLTDKQLYYFAYLSANYPPELVKAFFLIRLMQLDVKRRVGDLWKCVYKGRTVYIDASELAPGIEQLKFLDTSSAGRPAQMQGFNAVNVLLQDDFTFYDYLRTETFWQRFLETQDFRFVTKMANYLYRTSKGEYADMKELSQCESATIILWYAGLKEQLAQYFPDFFARPANGKTIAQVNIMEINDAQIRALTGGDITKEQQVLNAQCWRALAELNAKARESKELKKLYAK